MEKKIEKLELPKGTGDIEIDHLSMVAMAKRINEIIDYLNTQPQAEEKTKLVMPPSAYEQAEKEGFNMKNKIKSELLPESTPEVYRSKEDMERTDYTGYPYSKEFQSTTQDTPEQKEEWEFDLRNLMYRDGEQLRCAGEGKPYTGEYRELVVSMIKNLLLEREMFTKEELFMLKLAINDIHNKGNSAYDEIGEKIKRELGKLNKKK